MAIDLDAVATHRSRGDELSLHGIRLGDDAERLRELPITGGEPREPGLSFGSGKVSRLLPDGTARELSLAEVVDLTLSKDGRLRTRDAIFDVERGRVVRMFLNATALEPLELASEARVIEVFGAPDGVTRSHGTVSFHYPSRHLRVHWSSRTSAPVSVSLGPDDWRPRTFTAKDLLAAFLELAPTLESTGWDLAEPNDYPPRRVRFERLQALLRAFDVPGLEAMATGTLIDEQNPARYAKAAELLRSHVRWKAEREPAHHPPLKWAYQLTLRYRREAEGLLRHNDGWLECASVTLLGSIHVTHAANEVLRPALEPIDEILCAFLDPEPRSFRLEELVELGYPDVDLAEIDMEHL